MEWLRQNGYTVIRTRRLESFLLEGEPLPPKPVVIHFDDGYRSVYENALPVLREFGYPCAIFLPTRALDRRYGDFLTWKEVEELAREGVEFGVHGHGHSRVGTPAPGETLRDYASRVRSEFQKALDRFRAHGLDSRWVAYPYGEYNDTVLEVCRELGFRLGFSQDPGAVDARGDPLRIHRFAVVGSVADESVFRERMGYGALHLLDPVPRPGLLSGPQVSGFSVRVADPGRYEPGSANLFVSERGRLPARFDPKTGRIEAPGVELSRRFNRVLVSLRDRETRRYALSSWLILLPGGKR